MNRISALKAPLFLVLAIGFFSAYRYGKAQEQSSELGNGQAFESAPTFPVEIPAITSTKHVLEGTYINSASLPAIGSIPPETFIPIDTRLTVACPGTTGTCSIQADMLVQNGGTTATGNVNRICLYVDGKPGPNCDEFAGETSADGRFTNATNSDIVSDLKPGNHTVQMYFWSSQGTTAAHYEVNYHVYEP